MSRAGAFLLLVAPVMAAVDGTVVNQTSGQPQGGATVTLYRLGQDGMESVESVKSGADGKFVINQKPTGPHLLQTAFDGVTYNHMLPPAAPQNGITLQVYSASKQPGKASVAQHMVLFEPSERQMIVSESYIFRNDGKTAWNDPDNGTLRFFLPPEAKGIVQVNATAPQGMPIRRAAEKTAQPNIYKVDFPIKPGETRIDLTYLVPFTGAFEGRSLFKGTPTRLVAPNGVTLKGEGIEDLGKEPRTQAGIYNVKSSPFKVTIEGVGSLRADSGGGGEPEQKIEQIMPTLYSGLAGSAGLIDKILAVKWVLLVALTTLGLGFALLYRAQAPVPAKGPKPRK